MVIPKGNFTALQQLKPTQEAKYGDLADGLVDYWIQNNKIQEAKKLKELQEKGESIYNITKELKVDGIETIPQWQEQAGDLYWKTIQQKSLSERLAKDVNVPYEQKYKEAIKAQNMIVAYKNMASLIGTAEGRKKMNESLAQLNNNEYFTGDENANIIKSAMLGAFKMDFNDNGMIETYYVREDDNKTTKVNGDFIQLLSNGFAKDESENINKWKNDVAGLSIEKTKYNRDGNTTVEKEIAQRKEAEAMFDAQFGGYNASANVNNNWFKQMGYTALGKNIKTADNYTQEDYDAIKKYQVDDIMNRAKQSYSSVQEKTAAELEAQRLRNEENRIDIKNKRAGKSSSDSKAPKIIVSTNATVSRLTENGNRLDVSGGTTINIDDKTQIVGYKFKNKGGNGFHTRYAILGTDEKGRRAFQSYANRTEINEILSGVGIDYDGFEDTVLSGDVATTKIQKNDMGRIKYDKAYAPQKEEDNNTSATPTQRLQNTFNQNK